MQFTILSGTNDGAIIRKCQEQTTKQFLKPTGRKEKQNDILRTLQELQKRAESLSRNREPVRDPRNTRKMRDYQVREARQ